MLLLEKLSHALEKVDSSSGAIGNAVNNATDALAPIIGKAPVDNQVRGKWFEPLRKAIEDDDIPYIELLPDYWGTLCHSSEPASYWADELISPVRITWSIDRSTGDRFVSKILGPQLGNLIK